MAEALVVGALVNGFANAVLERLISPEFVNLVVGKKLNKKLIDKLKSAIWAAQALAADAEQKQFGDGLVREWLDSLRDALYTADDLLDRIFTKAQIRSKATIHLPSFLHLSDRKMVTKIEDVIERIQDLERRRDILGLIVLQTGSSSSWRPPPSASLERGTTVYGRDADKQALIEMLNHSNDHKLSVISIVGMGGVGKTTLAQWLYNNKDLMKGFDLKAWICVSENFDVVETTKDVMKEINAGVLNLDSFNSLQQHLKEKLSENKFFIVLDDVWSEDRDKWNTFITPFQHGKKGSILLLTTRNKNVGPTVQNYNSYPIEGLSDDYCWSIFADNASFSESNWSSELEGIGRKIVKKCDGLPLAAETLGRLLRTKHDVREWNKILSSDIWEIPITDSKIVPALLISYYHLPAHLKRCFVYSSLYPKDHQFEKNELILLWMAEDLLRPPKREETLEEVGCECFDDLASRLFFKQVRNDDEKYFVMHDLMHDLATFLAGKFYGRLSELGEKEEMGILTRHLSYNRPISGKIYSSGKIESLRTLLNTNLRHLWIGKESRRILSENKYLRVLSSEKLIKFPDSIVKLIHLRYLNLSWSDFKVLPRSLCNLCNLQTLKLRDCFSLTMLPSSLGELIHLCYLDLSRSAIKTLPESLCKLSYLQTLKLRSCPELTMLPNGMYNLLNLRHLDIRDTPIEEMPKGMGKLKQLHILSNYIVGKHEDNGIQELGGILNLHGSFAIQKLENVVDVNQAKSARIIDKKHIEELLLEWSSDYYMVSDIQIEGDVLDSLQPHTGLKELRIKGYKGKIFPDWLGQHSYNNMTHVSLVSCKNCCKLPSLGQLPSLKSLIIEGFSQLKCIGDEFYKNEEDHTLHIAPFSSLETLQFEDMPCWEVWNLPGSEAFPQLKKLEIRKCPMLKGDMVNQMLMKTISSSSDVSKYEESANYTYMSLSLDAFPNLKNLKIKLCENLESISMSEAPHTALQNLTISWCHKLVSLTEEGLAAPNLTHLELKYCSKLKALPRKMDTLLPNLLSLYIQGCGGIYRFPEGGLPPNLERLCMRGYEGLLRGLSSMAKLGALTHLVIYGRGCERVKSFPEVGMLPLLPSLTTLQISYFDNMETLECNELLRLTSLQYLHIQRCPKLQNMAGDKLPSSLLLLEILLCRLLEEGCKNKHQHIWPKIQHIPTIQVNGQQIV